MYFYPQNWGPFWQLNTDNNFFEDLFGYLELSENCSFFRNNTYHQYHDGALFLNWFNASINR